MLTPSGGCTSPLIPERFSMMTRRSDVCLPRVCLLSFLVFSKESHPCLGTCTLGEKDSAEHDVH